VIETTPASLELLELGVMHDGGELLGERRVDRINALLDGLGDVPVPGNHALERLIDQVGDEVLGDRLLGHLGGVDDLVQEAGCGLGRRRGSGSAGLGLRFAH
jgi:hypothetical protein